VRAGVHIRVYAHGDRRNFFPARGDAVDARQFCLAFDIEGINALLERELDFRRGFAHAGKDTFLGVAPAAMARRSSPSLTMSKPLPSAASVRSTARLEFDFIGSR